MRIVVSANGTNLDAQASSIFGRCPTYIFVETDTLGFEAVENPSMNAPGGAGIQAAQFVIERKCQTVVTGNVGPNAFDVLQAANVPVHLFGGGTVREAVKAYKAGLLPAAGGASAPAHAGMGMGMGRVTAPPSPTPPPAAPSRQEEITGLREMDAALRKRVAEMVERLEQLEKRSE